MTNLIEPKIRLTDILKLIIATGFGLGLLPIAPGSFGALLGVAGHIIVVQYCPAVIQLFALISFLIVVCLAHYWLSPWAVKYWNNPDPKNFILDEIAGYLVVPILFNHGNLWQIAAVGYVVFRVFDVIKLPIARQIDRNMHNATGIILDDIVSGLYTVILMFFLRYCCYAAL